MTGSAALLPSQLHRDEAVVALPVAHIIGFAALLGLAAPACPCTSSRAFVPSEVLDAIEQRRATIFMGVPAMYRLMDEAGASDRDLRASACGDRAPT